MKSNRGCGKKEARVIQVNEEEFRKHISEIVRESVEETPNGLLEAEADQLCLARRYKRNTDRTSTRAGHYTEDYRRLPVKLR